MKGNQQVVRRKYLPKSPTGIQGFDEITSGGLPKGRPTLVCGGAGCGKTLLSMGFLVNGATMFNEPGVFMSFEENAGELRANVASLGYDLEDLENRKMLVIDHVQIERSEIEETGEYDLEGLFVRLNYAVGTVGAKRVVLDSIESLFSSLPNRGILRAEIRRLFRWLKEKQLTAIVTAERGDHTLTREGLEEYVSDCVILLDHRVKDQASTRRMRIVKYRGSVHGTNEYPFLIDETGITILPISSLRLEHEVSTQIISSGIPELDAMLGKKGFYKGSSILISGTAGTGKTSILAHFASTACKRGEKVLFFSLEESSNQIIRNMSSIGIGLSEWVNKGNLKFHSVRPTSYGLEMHLDTMLKLIREFRPSIVLIDPVNSFVSQDNELDAKAMSIRLIDYIKSDNITGIFTTLTSHQNSLEDTDIMISSMIDAWILLRDIEIGGERNRGIYILKARGMAHSNQIREFILTNDGVKLQDVYLGMEGVLTGSARKAQEAKDRMKTLTKQQEIESMKLKIHQRKKLMEAKIDAIRAEYDMEEAALLEEIGYANIRKSKDIDSLKDIAKSRKNSKTPNFKK